MSQTFADIILHTVFSTKDRSPWILPEIELELFQYICGVARNLKSPVIAINGVQDHLHVLLLLSKGITSSDLLSEIKSSSSRWIKTKGNKYQNFCWQSGYGAFSVSRPNLENVVKYIARQKEHHKTFSFKEEFLALVQHAGISYDQKYLWD